MPKHARLFSLTLFCVLSIACGDDGPSGPDENGNGNGDTEVDPLLDVPFEPDPLNVTISVDAARATTDSTSAEDPVTLATTDAVGTTYTLVIPAGAVMHDVEIRMTPLTDVDGFPLSDGMLGGVRLHPSGLHLLQAATLTIEPAAAMDRSQASAFGFSGNGQDFHLRPATFTPGVVTLSIDHFSGYGVGQGTAADRAAQQQNVPTDYADYAQQRMANILTRVRQRILMGQDEEFTAQEDAEIAELIGNWYTIVVRPKLSAAATECSGAQEALGLFFSWARQIELLGVDGAYQSQLDEGYEFFDAIIDNCVEEYYATCVAENDIGQLLNLLAVERIRQLMGLTAGARAMEYYYKCSTFELEISSTMTIDGYSTTEFEGSVLFLGVPPAPVSQIDYGTVLSVDATFYAHLGGCQYSGPVHTTTPPGVKPDLTAATVPRDSLGNPTGKADATYMRLDIWPGTMISTITESCPDGEGGYTSYDWDIGSTHLLGWLLFHSDEFAAGAESGLFVIEFGPDDLPDGSLYGRLTWSRSDYGMTEATVLNVWHRPEQDGRSAAGRR